MHKAVLPLCDAEHVLWIGLGRVLDLEGRNDTEMSPDGKWELVVRVPTILVFTVRQRC